MDIMQQGVVTLLRSAITGEKLPLPEGFDLETAYPELKKHHMDALLYDGAVRCGISKQSPVMQTLFQKYCKALLVSEGQMRQLARIFCAFDENGIDYMPLKGSKMKALYPKPELRYMGDADILIRTEQQERIAQIMEELDFQRSGESDHEIVWRHKELLVELHKRLIPSYNKDFYSYFKSGWQLACVEEGTRYAMTPEDEWLFLFVHFAKHFRDGGIGCRYMVDLWMYLRTHPDLNQALIRRKLEELELLEFEGSIRQVLDVWFSGAEADGKAELIKNYIFTSGSWGSDHSRLLSRVVRDAKGELSDAKGKTVYFLQTAFPNVRMLEGKYTILKKAPWMLPAVWVYRPFYKLFSESRDLKRKRQDMELLTANDLQTRREFLQAVGLEYHF